MAGNVVEFTIRGVDDFSRVMNGLNSKMGVVTKGLKIATIGAAALTAATAAVAIPVIRVSKEFEKMTASLKTVTGSAENAAGAMNFIKGIATDTPFQVTELTNAFIKLKALGLVPSEDAIKSYGNTASAMGKSLNQMVEAVADAITGEFERLKEFGIKARVEGDNVALTFQGTTTTIKNNSQAIEGYLRDIGNVQFAGAMEEQMKTLNGRISNLSDATDNLFDTIGKAGVLDLAKNAVTALTDGVKSLTENFFIVAATAKQVFTGISKAIDRTFSAEGFDAFVSGAETALKNVFEFFVNIIPNIGTFIVGVFKTIWTSYTTLAQWAIDKTASIFTGADVKTLGEVLFEDIPKKTEEARAQISGAFTRITDDTKSAMSGTIGYIAEVLGVTTESIMAEAEQWKFAALGANDAIYEAVENTTEATRTLFDELSLNFTDYMASVGNTAQQIAQTIGDTAKGILNTISDSIADAIVNGESMYGVLRNIGTQVVSALIKQLIELGFQTLVTEKLVAIAKSKALIAELGTVPPLAAGNAFASMASSLITLPGAPAAAAAAFTAASGIVAPGIASASALAAPGFHKGGVVPNDGKYELLGGEVVIPRNPNQDIINALPGGGGGRSIVIENLNLHTQQSLFDMDRTIARQWAEDILIPALEDAYEHGVSPTEVK